MKLRKRLISLLLIVAMLILPAFADTAKHGEITGNNVNMRSGPSLNHAVIGVYSAGTAVTVIGESGDWYNIQLGGRTGYMVKAYIKIKASENGEAIVALTTEHADKVGTVKGSVVNIRAGAGTNYPVVGVAVLGDKLVYNETLEKWYKVKLGDKVGYIYAEYFEPDNTVPETANDVKGKVTGSVVNLRSGAGTTYGVLGKVLKDDLLTVKAKSGDWYLVDFNGKDAYIISDYLKIDEGPALPQADTSVSGTGVVTGSIVNLRMGAGTSFSIVGQVKKDDSLKISGENNGWYLVAHNGGIAYISASFIKFQAEIPTEQSSWPKQGSVTASLVNIRAGAGTDHPKLAQANMGDIVTILDEKDDWYKIETKSGQTGYIISVYVKIAEPLKPTEPIQPPPAIPQYTVTDMSSEGTVAGNTVNMREHPTTTSGVVALLQKGTVVKITGHVNNEWYRVEYNNSKGFMSTDFVLEGVAESTPPPEAGQSEGEKIVEYAMQFIGVPYVYGGKSPITGFDCSGLTQYVYEAFGYNIPRVTQHQAGVKVTKAELKPADLVFFNTQGTGISHVGMYVGDGQFIHAPTPGKTVCLTRLDSSFYVNKFVTAVRIISE